MKHAYTCAPADWAHHSWLERGRPVRNERAARAAHAFLFGRYPQLIRVALADVPPALPIWPRPACARLCRIVAALAFAPSLRRVVAAQARAAFAAGVAPQLLAEIQRHPRAASGGLNVEPAPSLFSRRDMTAAGLALSLEAAADSRYAFWWSLRLPREIYEAACRYRVRDLSAAEARELVAEARRLMEAHPC
ncbi:hypothetical protein DR64_815 [Paraburkholderia xenovorans LB400]|jgi:hypothetical protein|uniref:Uncharacterized protein n=1 Tax=Paraburkholderia xenovorans (strain LB400) TaxID=266265 RepID=Q141Y5_PARXL|nr:hypothetical protein [Paraburkholderia xenovorans]ABE29854.1 Hypothetical protein Bxe_A3125 [Paraburkholderia xenovorans LB400]AIP33551.1 hypothetical protein DR64_815 [Paraburkholderia xenovorans LB400]NPT39513.1 hypothetical protein [Paraburkholderia xenovorans]